jgi:hypothetical protein
VRSPTYLTLLITVLLALVRPARADSTRDELERKASSSDESVAADALFRLAETDDEAFRFADALREYDACAARSPSSRWTPRAVARARALRERSEGDFAPLTRLESVRRDPRLADDPAAIDGLAGDAEGFPPGHVQVEARMLVAEAYLGRLRRPAPGLAELEKVVSDPHADVVTSRQAARELVETRVNQGDLEGAARRGAELGTMLEPKVLAGVRQAIRRKRAHRAATAVLTLLGGLALASVVRAATRKALAPVAGALWRMIPLAAVYAAYAAVVGGLLASSYESGNAAPFLALGFAILIIACVSRAWSAAGSPRPVARILRALLCASSVVAAGFLILERIDISYLQGFGL